MQSTPPTVLIERREGVGLLTLNRPAKLNALTFELLEQLQQALHDFDVDESVGAIVITGAGERAFSAGGDLGQQVEAMAETAPRRTGKSPFKAILNCATPTLAAIRGYCFGGGALMAINCDIRLAGDDARFKFHGATYGRALGGAVLPRIIGAARAKELLFTGDEIDAAEALRIGLVNHVVEPARVLEATLAMAARIAANSGPAVRATKETIERAMAIHSAQEHEDAANRELSHSPDSTARFREAAERVIGIRPKA